MTAEPHGSRRADQSRPRQEDVVGLTPEPITLEKLRQFVKYHAKRRVFDHPAREEAMDVQLLGLDLGRVHAELRERCPDARELVRVRYQGQSYPILCVDTGDPAGARTLLVNSGIHGNEQAAILAAPRILDDVAQHPGCYRGVRVVMVCPANPVGAAHQSRYNGDGFDINRDFVHFETAEARALRDLFLELRPAAVVSLHEGPQAGAFFFANRAVPASWALDVLEAFRAHGVKRAAHDYFGAKLIPPGYSPVDEKLWTLSMLWARLLGMMGMGTWCDLQGVPELTLETCWKDADGEARVRAHQLLVRSVAP